MGSGDVSDPDSYGSTVQLYETWRIRFSVLPTCYTFLIKFSCLCDSDKERGSSHADVPAVQFGSWYQIDIQQHGLQFSHDMYPVSATSDRADPEARRKELTLLASSPASFKAHGVQRHRELLDASRQKAEKRGLSFSELSVIEQTIQWNIECIGRLHEHFHAELVTC